MKWFVNFSSFGSGASKKMSKQFLPIIFGIHAKNHCLPKQQTRGFVKDLCTLHHQRNFYFFFSPHNQFAEGF